MNDGLIADVEVIPREQHGGNPGFLYFLNKISVYFKIYFTIEK
jgi:hypothetical protein